MDKNCEGREIEAFCDDHSDDNGLASEIKELTSERALVLLEILHRAIKDKTYFSRFAKTQNKTEELKICMTPLRGNRSNDRVTSLM
jgi:hypothetical protein